MKLFFTFVILFLTIASQGQTFTGSNLKLLKLKEDSLTKNSRLIITGKDAATRFNADSIFTRSFVKALLVKNSFEFPFDSLQSIAKVYPADSSFRIFTWQLVINENFVVQHGAIQMKTADGSLKLFPLIDKSAVIQNNRDTIADNLNWIGAVYYKLVQTEYKNKKYYTLLGFDDNNIRTDKRVIEVLSFENGKPIFGGHYFIFENSNVYTRDPGRVIMEFKKETSPRLTFDKDLNMIIMEHLVSETGEASKKYTLVPDGDYEGFKWVNGKWVYVSKIYNQVTPLGQSPVPQPIRDDKGNIDPTKLKGGTKPTGN